MHKKLPLISVIVPVYNVEKDLPRCIDSIFAQTFIDFEILLIDDGSPDNSGKICDEYAEKDKRIRVFHKKNGGVSSARNYGIKNACGEWICFIDSDDIVNEKYLKDLIGGIIDNCYQGLIIQGINYCNKNCKINKSLYFNKVILYQKNILDAFSIYKIQKYGYPVSKLYNRNVLIDCNVKFDEQVNCIEDTLFVLTYFLHIKYVSFISGSNYYYINTNLNSNSKKFYSYNDELYLYSEYNECVQNIILKYKNYVKENDYNIIELYKFSADLLMRVIRSLYNPNFNIRKKERLEKLQSLHISDKNIVLTYYKPNRFIYKISKFLFVHKSLLLFDYYQTFLFFLIYKLKQCH